MYFHNIYNSITFINLSISKINESYILHNIFNVNIETIAITARTNILKNIKIKLKLEKSILNESKIEGFWITNTIPPIIIKIRTTANIEKNAVDILKKETIPGITSSQIPCCRVVVTIIILRTCPEVKVALKAWLPPIEVNKSMLVFILRIVKPISNPKKSALASKVALVFVKLLPTEVRLKNSIVVLVVICSSRVIESTKIVKLDIEEKNVVSVIVKALIE